MITHRMPQPGKYGRFGSGMERPLLIVLFILLIVVAVLSIWQIQNYFTVSPLPTQAVEATLPAITTNPSILITPVGGPKGTLITVQGQGWQPNEHLIICLDDLGNEAVPLIYAEVKTDTLGKFIASFVFPTNVQWRSLPDISVVAESVSNRQRASAVFELLTNTPTPIATSQPTSIMPTGTVIPSPTAVPSTPTPACTYRMSFVADVTIPDDTIVLPGVSLVKTWRIRNSGTCSWQAGTSWVFVAGNQMGGPNTAPVPLTNPGETADVSVSFVAPVAPGTYTSYWTLRTPTGALLRQQYFVRIVVAAPTPTLAPSTPTPTLTPITPTSTPTPTPIPATSTPIILNWRGEYFNNTTLAGMPVLVRDDTAVNFNWDDGAAANGLPADNFSAGWTRNLYFEAGTYRFYAHSDDGVRLWVDNIFILNEWHDATGDTYTAEINLSAGNHPIHIEYYEALGTAQLQVWWQQVEHYPDWRGEYWSNRSLNGSPALVRNDATINFNWGTSAPAAGLPADNFSARWARTLFIAEGNYRFTTGMDDGLRLYVDNILLIDEWHDGSSREVGADIWLAAGNHDLRVEYYEGSGEALVAVSWEQSGSISGWHGEYWGNKTLSDAPVLTRTDYEIDFNWGFSAPAPMLPDEEFSVRWIRQLNFEAGLYRLYAQADDGVRVYVDGQQVIDQWHFSSADRIYQADIQLSGTHTILVEYYEDHLTAEVHFWYEYIED